MEAVDFACLPGALSVPDVSSPRIGRKALLGGTGDGPPPVRAVKLEAVIHPDGRGVMATSATIKNRHARLFIIRVYFLTTGMSVRLRKTHRERFGINPPSRRRNGQLSPAR